MENETKMADVESQDAPPANDVELTEKQQLQFEEQSSEFVGQWSRLISTTNWEKGQIIQEWRDSLNGSELPEASFTDERWSQTVGGVTPQHVGRLRRTFKRFGHVYEQYQGLFWSHFYAALEWDDSEMWLEGAVQNNWSVSVMRNQRWETLGKDPADKPKITDIVVSESDEEMQALAAAGRAATSDREFIEGPIPEGPDFGDEPQSSGSSTDRATDSSDELAVSEKPSGPKIKPFESFTDLPDDFSDALNELKVAIITHKAKDWEEIPLADVLGVLDALKELAKAASE